MVINQLLDRPNAEHPSDGRTGGLGLRGPTFVVNGRIQPIVHMKPGEGQMWRIVNTSSISGARFSAPKDGFAWKRLAPDGVQLRHPKYQKSEHKPALLAYCNRTDRLLK